MTECQQYKHLTYNDRIKIEALYNHKVSKQSIALEVGCSLSTLYRELKRGRYSRLTTTLANMDAYSADIAQKDYDFKASAKGAPLKLGKNFKLSAFVEEKIQEGDSPAAAIGKAKESPLHLIVNICIKTLYNYIHSDVFLNITSKNLPRGGTQKQTHEKVQRVRIKKPLASSIEDRPEEINERTTFGHWEMDTVVGKRNGKGQVLLVLTERLTRNEIIVKIAGRTQDAVKKALDKLERKHGKYFKRIFRTITIDNGGEFLDTDKLEKSCRTKSPRTKVYYCHPYSSYERGSNENANGMIRRKIPKGTPMENYTDNDIANIQNWMNTYPRKIHNYSCAEVLFNNHIEQIYNNGLELT